MSFRDRIYIDRSSFMLVWVFRTAHISIGHLPINLSFLGPHLYQSVIFPVSLRVFELGPYLYRSVIFLLVQLSFSGSPLYRSTIFLSVCVQFRLGPHLYRSIIVLLVWVWVFWVAPISIDHQFVFSLSCDRTYIYRSFILSVELSIVRLRASPTLSLRFSGRTYIDRPFFYQFEFNLSFWDHTYIDRSFFVLV